MTKQELRDRFYVETGILEPFERFEEYISWLEDNVIELSKLHQPPVRQSLPSDVYTELDIDKAYKCGERQSTFYKKNGTVILPRNYEGIDG